MKTIENLKNVALVLFIILGLTHIVSGLMFTNGYIKELSFILNRSLDIPFAMTAVIYAGSGIYLNSSEKTRKPLGVALILISLLIFILLIYINLLIPDKVSLSEL